MNQKLVRIMKPLSFLAVAVVAAGAFIATAGDGTCPLSGKTAKAEGTCALEGKTAKAEGTCKLEGKAAKAEGTCKLKGAAPAVATENSGPEATLAKDGGACEGGVCPLTGKQVADSGAECEGGVCPTSGKQVAANEECEGGVCPSGTKDIVNTVLQDGSFSTLLLAARAAGVMDKLNCPEPKTLLAPTNEAFQKLPAEQWAALLQDDDALQAVLSRHIIDGAIPAADLAVEGKVCPSLGAKRCEVSGKTTFGTANATRVDIIASNGIIHVIDQVLLPEAPAETAAAESTVADETVQVASAE
jgi:uncharacterized surface protein with fasciclin (FAS1) repeats